MNGGEPRTGAGTRLTANALGFAVSAPRKGQSFNHPWKPSLGGRQITFALGLVNLLVPKIEGNPMSSGDGSQPAVLLLDPGKKNERNESWICLEVEPVTAPEGEPAGDDEGELTQDSRIEILHRSDGGKSLDLKIGRTAIAMLVWRGDSPVRAFPILHFHLRYTRVIPPPGGGAVRHFFF